MSMRMGPVGGGEEQRILGRINVALLSGIRSRRVGKGMGGERKGGGEEIGVRG